MVQTTARILNFHGVGEPIRRLDPGEGPFWISVNAFRAIIDQISARADQDRIGLTFDDGNVSDVEIALPVLQRAGLSARFFLLAGRLDSPGFIDREGAATLRAAGMGLGVHGWDHVDWRRLDAAGRKREFIDARAEIEACVGATVDEAAVPFGAYNRRTLAHLREAGYRAIYTSDGGSAGGGPVFSRLSVRNDMASDRLAAFLDGREPHVARARRLLATARKRLL